MRFQNYLNESSIRFNKPKELSEKEWRDLYKLWNLLYKKCKPFMKEFEKAVKVGVGTIDARYLFRGMRDRGNWSIENVRKDRMPKDSSIEFHEMMNDAFEDAFGVRARSESVFATTLFSEAKHYGKVYIIFPMGKYKLIWSDEVEDLYSRFEDEIRQGVFGDEPPRELYDEWEDEWEWEFGSEDSRGEWVAQSYDIRDSNLNWAVHALKDHVASNIDRDDYETDEEYEQAVEDVMSEVDEGDFEWEAEIDKDSYIERQEDIWKEKAMSQSDMNDFVDKYYKSGTLKEYLRDSNGVGFELHVVTDKYVAVSADFAVWITELLKADYQPNLPFEEFKDFD